MNPHPLLRIDQHRTCALGAVVASCLLTMLPSVIPAATHYPVRRGSVSELFGNTGQDFGTAMAKSKGRQFAPFEEQAAGEHPDVLSGSACYDAGGFTFVIISRGVQAESVPQCGGSLSLYLREGMQNTATDGVPVSVHYDMREFPVSKPGKPHFSLSVEATIPRSEPTRFSSDCPSYRNITIRQPPRPATRFIGLDDGWALTFSFRWIDFRDRLPFRAGQPPASWRLVATRVRPDGSVATWGTLADPVILNWATAADSFVDELSKKYFVAAELGPAYHEHAETIRTFWTAHRTEKWIGYLDPGIPTFEPKNPDSDAIFFTRCVEPFLDGNDNIDKAIIFGGKENIEHPRVLSMRPAERAAIVDELDRILYVDDMIDVLRRDYLLDRFLDRPVAQRVVPRAAQPEKLKPFDRNRDLTAGELNLDDVGVTEDKLDDVAY